MALELGSLLAERYRIEAVLGQGGMSAVYLATDTRLDMQCAIKENLTLSPDTERLFRREATLLATLRHPNLPRVTNHFLLSERQYLVMDYVAGEDLKQRLERTGPLPEAEAVGWMAQVCNALSYLHALNPPIIHRDIKPANIKITPNNEAILVDFGIAKAATAEQQTRSSTMALTPGFAPPEQYGLGRTGPQADQYALAATLYTLLVGQMPPDSVERLLGNAQLPAPNSARPELSAGVVAAIQRGMALEAEDRFATILDFKHALLNPTPDSGAPTLLNMANTHVQPKVTLVTLVHPTPTPATPLTPTPARPVPKRPWPLLAGLLGLGVVIGLALGVGGSWGMAQFAAQFAPSPTPTDTLTSTPSLVPPSATPSPSPAPTHTALPPTATSTVRPSPTSTIAASPTQVLAPTLGPALDSGRIAFISDRDGKYFQVYTMRVDGSEVRQLTTDANDKWQPEWNLNGTQLAWSPDGKQLVYVTAGADTGLDLWVINADGTGAQNLTNAKGDDYQPTFCRDGSLWFTSKRVGGVQQIFYYASLAVAQKGQRPTNFSATHNSPREFDPTLYPNCGRVLFNTTLDGAVEIWRYWTDCANCYRKLRTYKTERGMVDEPALAPDGKSFLYTRHLEGVNEVMRAAEGTEQLADQQLTNTLDNFSAQWSPDGLWVVFVSTRDGNREVYVMSNVGEGQHNLTQNAATDIDPVWQPVAP